MFFSTLYRILLATSTFHVALASPRDAAETHIAPLHIPPVEAHNLREGSYIVVLRDDILPSVFDSHLNFVSLSSGASTSARSGDVPGFEIKHVYDSVIGKGYAAKLPPDVLELVRRQPEVQYVEQDQVGHGGEIQRDAPWGISRISHRRNTFKTYMYPKDSGEGVVVYVIDSGINIAHDEFEGRASWGKSFIDYEDELDTRGHGTHVAGIVASRKYGVAKKAQVVAVKVLNGTNFGWVSDFIAGLQWAVQNSEEKYSGDVRHKGTVINKSLYSGPSKPYDTAVNKAVKAGFHVVVCAANFRKDACEYSPASAALSITVGAINASDEFDSNYSNHGRCVDILAPGTNVLSAGKDGTKSTMLMTGTSMATPHVVGIIATFLSIYPSKVFNPRSADKSGPLSASFLSPFRVMCSLLPDFMTSICPELLTIEGHSDNSVITENEGWKPMAPERMKRALKAIAWRGVVKGAPRYTPNLLAFNNYTRDKWWEFGSDSALDLAGRSPHLIGCIHPVIDSRLDVSDDIISIG